MAVKLFETKTVVRVIGILCILAAGTGSASDDDHEQAKRLRDAGQIVSLEQVLKDAHLRQGGRIIEIELEQEDGRYVYEVEFVDERGRVHEYYYDAGDGSFLWEKRGESED